MPSGVSSCCFWEYCQRGWKRRCKNEVTLIFDLLNFLGENDVTISLSTLYYPSKTPKITKIAEIQYQLSNNSKNKQYNFQYKSFSYFCYFCIVDTFECRFKRGLLLSCHNWVFQSRDYLIISTRWLFCFCLVDNTFYVSPHSG